MSNKFLLPAFAFFFFTTYTYSQNLVPNPSFEYNISCPQGPSETFKAVPWVQPTGHTGTSDYFNVCNTSLIPLQAPPVGVPLNLLGTQGAKTGSAYCGFFSIDGPTDGDYREYIQAPLTSPLTIGVRYCVRFYVSLSDLSTNSTDGIGAYFSTQPVTGPAALPLQFTAQVRDSTVITNYQGWHEVYGEFVADQPYAYITIGNFAVQGTTTISTGPPYDPNTVPPTIPMPGAYYYIDDVYVGEALSCPVPCNLQFTNASTVADCNMNNGIAAVTVGGGSGNYSYLWYNGATTATLPNVAYGLYELTVNDGPGCSLTQNVFVGQNSSLAVSFSPGFLQCASSPDGDVDITVTGGTSPYTYLWSNGATTEDIANLTGGVYTVVVTDAAGCMLTDSTELTSIFASESVVTVTDESCAGANNGSIYLTPGGIFPFPPSYQWSNGATTAGIYNLAPGTYTVVTTDFFGCVDTLSATVGSGTGSFSVNISQQGDTLYATTAPSYQWYHNGSPIAGATQQTYIITVSGNYYVVASGGTTCIDTSNYIETACICTNGLEENSLFTDVQLFPNPANDVVNLFINLNKPEATEVRLLDIAGREVWQNSREQITNSFTYKIPVSGFSEGVYFVQVRAGNDQQHIKVIIKK